MKSKCDTVLLHLTLLLAATLSVCVQAAPVRKKIAIEAGKIITISGKEITNGVILVEDGKIKAVGKKADIPWDAFVIEAKDQVVMPGFVLAHTSRGLDSANERIPEVPFLSTFDAIDPLQPFFEDSLRDGVVAMLVLPGNNTLLGGTGTVVKPHGLIVEEMLIKRYTGLKISLRPSGNTSRMGHMQRFRRYMADLKTYKTQFDQRKADATAAKKPFDEEIDLRKQPMFDLLERKLRAFIYCDKAADVIKALEIQATHKFDTVLVLSPDCYKAASLIAKKKIPVILDPQLIAWETDDKTQAEQRKVIPQIMQKAGVKFAFQTDTSQYGTRYPWYQAAQAVKYGVKREEALKAITLYPAQFIGVDDRFGSIQPGKDASLIFLTGDPLDAQTWVDKVMISGEIIYEKAKDLRLRKLLEIPKSAAHNKKEDNKAEDDS
jgi:imidazolonepropionase-like amidohydrolase